MLDSGQDLNFRFDIQTQASWRVKQARKGFRKENLNPKKREQEIYSRLKTRQITVSKSKMNTKGMSLLPRSNVAYAKFPFK